MQQPQTKENYQIGLEKVLKAAITKTPDFPIPGVTFLDMFPILSDPDLTDTAIELFAEQILRLEENIDVIAAAESRGFIWGALLAQYLKLPFVPVRKAGKMPNVKATVSYDLEYGKAIMEMQDTIGNQRNVLFVDDLLAIGGTADAAAQLIKQLGGKVGGFAFLIELEKLKGRDKILTHSQNIISLLKYDL